MDDLYDYLNPDLPGRARSGGPPGDQRGPHHGAVVGKVNGGGVEIEAAEVGVLEGELGVERDVEGGVGGGVGEGAECGGGHAELGGTGLHEDEG